ncbi:retinol dehydrogenase 12-like [Cloeon dipterum]|uniref:retinol dehydrogenase 12-like n=1 Tax=Cloeon dipterum TaxID=197152 RepID=UPI00321F7BBE
MFSAKCKSKARLEGRTAIVTGSNTGIGYETAKELLKRGARVILANRDLEKSQKAGEMLCAEVPACQLRLLRLDLASLKSVQTFAREILATESNVHLLINNAGVFACPYTLTEDGNEMQFQTNHLGHFLLTLLLLPALKASAPSRIINVSSKLHWLGKIDFDDMEMSKTYKPTKAYNRSKLCNMLFTKELIKRLQGTGVVAYTVDPGMVATEATRHLTGTAASMQKKIEFAKKSPLQGAQTTLHCALSEKLAVQKGMHYSECSSAAISCSAKRKEDAEKLWKLSEDLVAEFTKSGRCTCFSTVILILQKSCSRKMGLFRNGTCNSDAKLDGKTVVITGANSGIGFETARELAKRGARVVMANRNMELSKRAAEKIRSEVPYAQVNVVQLNLASLKSVESCADEILRTESQINILINNAGVFMCPFMLTEDDLETQFQTNHLGHFLLTLLLLPRIESSAPARIINVSSSGYKSGKINFNDLQSTKKYKPLGAYNQSKLCNILFTLMLTKRMEGKNVVAYAVNPGLVYTDITRHWSDRANSCFARFKCIAKTPEEGAQTTLHCALDEKLANQQSQIYFDDCRPQTLRRHATNYNTARKLWGVSEELVREFLED